MTHTVSSVVNAAIQHANWFTEENDRLRDLAEGGNAAEIRTWANEIRADWTGDSEDDAYWQETAADWDRVADAVEAEQRAISAAKAGWPEDDIREYIESHDDNDAIDEDQLLAMFRAVYGRSPEESEERMDMWSHVCNGVSHS